MSTEDRGDTGTPGRGGEPISAINAEAGSVPFLLPVGDSSENCRIAVDLPLQKGYTYIKMILYRLPECGFPMRMKRGETRG